jgi:exopolysaccharide biosynthesis protein
MTIEEIASVMKALGCVNAMNLDGGGSSTAYVMNRGVVNYPCDNQKFDHEGERGVATVIVFAGE